MAGRMKGEGAPRAGAWSEGIKLQERSLMMDARRSIRNLFNAHGQRTGQFLSPGTTELRRMIAQNSPLVGINQNPAAVHENAFLALTVIDTGQALVDRMVHRFGAGHQGQMLVDPRHPIDVKGLPRQKIGRVRSCINRIINAQSCALGRCNLLCIAQNTARLDIAEEISIVAIDKIVFLKFIRLQLHGSALLPLYLSSV